MTTDHLRLVLDQVRDTHQLCQMADQFAQARIPPAIHYFFRVGRLTALQKPRTSHALSTRAGTECVAHALQVLTEMDPMTTIVLIDGVGAYDSVSRKAMLEALVSMPGGSAVLPFVRLFYGQPSRYLWEDEEGAIHHIHQGEGGEQGDPPTYALALERLFAFLDDIYVTIDG